MYIFHLISFKSAATFLSGWLKDFLIFWRNVLVLLFFVSSGLYTLSPSSSRMALEKPVGLLTADALQVFSLFWCQVRNRYGLLMVFSVLANVVKSMYLTLNLYLSLCLMMELADGITFLCSQRLHLRLQNFSFFFSLDVSAAFFIHTPLFHCCSKASFFVLCIGLSLACFSSLWLLILGFLFFFFFFSISPFPSIG